MKAKYFYLELEESSAERTDNYLSLNSINQQNNFKHSSQESYVLTALVFRPMLRDILHSE